jgi:pimeloyl-ACP methyl ester carboxylesterase
VETDMNDRAVVGIPDSQMGAEDLRVGGVRLEAWRMGVGEPVLLLHDIDYRNGPRPFMELLAKDFSVLAPSHPGFGASELPPLCDSVDDLAYVYLDFLRDHGPMSLIGMGFGGWIAAEMAVRCCHEIQRLVLVDAVGVKTAGREVAEIADTFVMDPRTLLPCTWHDAVLGEQHMDLPGLGSMSETDLTIVLRNRQSAALFGWNPFMHDPKLYRRLYRITAPTLVVWGQSDRVVSPEYGRAFADAIPGARFETLEAAGHYPYLERPERFVELVSPFLQGS